jgi:glycosyltransferase involved in cell wall biosynthesis
MARPLRIEFAGALYHVTSRGDGREDIYLNDEDREVWLEVLGEVCGRYNWVCHTYCLMSNHYHILIETPESNLSLGMRQLNGGYTQRFNKRHNRVGHVFQGRFKGILVDKESYLLELARYIVLNPVRAKMVRKAQQCKKPGQRLVVRIHLQENRLPQYLQEADIEKIDRYIFIAPYRYEEFVEMHGLPRERAKLVFNTVHVDKFDLPKHPEAKYSLGFVGIVPWRKRFDKALELFDKLWHKDHRHSLRVKGKLPEDFPWMKTNPNFREKLALYDELYRKIEQAPWKNNVFFDGHGNDMPQWYQKIGYLVSTSDFEGSHQAVAEGMASGATPLILPWGGAETVYPKDHVFSSIDAMADYVLTDSADNQHSSYAREHFGHEAIVEQIRVVSESVN